MLHLGFESIGISKARAAGEPETFSSRAFPRGWGGPFLRCIRRRKARSWEIFPRVRAKVSCASSFLISASEKARHEAGFGRHGGAVIGIGKKNFFFGGKPL